MAAAPKYKVYTADGEYIASCKETEDAAAIVALHGNGATIRLGHTMVLWQEGNETVPAGESYDVVAETCAAREEAQLKKVFGHLRH